jgi:branched-subunit amino acid transport protein
MSCSNGAGLFATGDWGQIMSNIEMLLTTAGLILATFMSRAGLLLAGENFRPSARIAAALRFAPVCALAVLVVPQVLVQAGAVDVSPGNPRLPGALAAIAYFLWQRSISGSVLVGMLVFAALR